MFQRLSIGDAAAVTLRSVRGAINLLTPCRCVFCGEICTQAEQFCCALCRDDLPWLGPHCRSCARSLPAATSASASCGECLLHPPPFTEAAALFIYAFPVDAAIRALKFQRRLDYAAAFAALLAVRMRSLSPEIDAVIPVALNWRRQLRRGYNQAMELAAPMARQTGLPLVDTVERVRFTPYQTGLPARQRQRNLLGAFRARGRIRARHVLLIDDVMTTGATCRQLALTVLGAGALRVSVLVLARAHQAGFSA